MRWQSVVILAAMAASLVTAGCGPAGDDRQMSKVSGKVTYQDKPVTTGRIIFQPSGGAPGAGDLKADGSYELTTAIGPNAVTVFSRDPDQIVPGQAMPIRGESHIPEKYETPSTSGLTFDVQPGENPNTNFELTD